MEPDLRAGLRWSAARSPAALRVVATFGLGVLGVLGVGCGGAAAGSPCGEGRAPAQSPAALIPVDAARLAPTPPMGWNSWNRFHCDVSEALIRRTADAMVSSGMRDAGYRYVVIDDCWQSGRASDGTIVADPSRFPSGMRSLADYVHARGLRFGLYTDVGELTCGGRPGSFDHEAQDARTYAAWGVDFVKADWCHTQGLLPRVQYTRLEQALARAGRPIVLSVCSWGHGTPWEWRPLVGQMWRTTFDISDSWVHMITIADLNNFYAPDVAGPGHWNDPDMLEVGNGGMSDAEYRTHFSLWAIMAAPLIAGNDVGAMSDATRAILLNREVIAVDQDPAGVQGRRVAGPSYSGLQVWSRRLAAPGERAVALVNRSESPARVTARFSDVGLPAGARATVRDLWEHRDMGSFTDAYEADVAPHGVVMVRIAAPGG